MAPLLIKKTKDIRRLTPIECMRLQGFSDNHNKYGIMDGKVVKISDTQRYKQAGNAVTVDVVQAIADKIKKSNILK
jgi:DNA (cytosine-5)-methyltransferase 1